MLKLKFSQLLIFACNPIHVVVLLSKVEANEQVTGSQTIENHLISSTRFKLAGKTLIVDITMTASPS